MRQVLLFSLLLWASTSWAQTDIGLCRHSTPEYQEATAALDTLAKQMKSAKASGDAVALREALTTTPSVLEPYKRLYVEPKKFPVTMVEAAVLKLPGVVTSQGSLLLHGAKPTYVLDGMTATNRASTTGNQYAQSPQRR